MPTKFHPFCPNLVRHLFEKDASCLETGQAAILDLQDQLRGPPEGPQRPAGSAQINAHAQHPLEILEHV